MRTRTGALTLAIALAACVPADGVSFLVSCESSSEKAAFLATSWSFLSANGFTEVPLDAKTIEHNHIIRMFRRPRPGSPLDMDASFYEKSSTSFEVVVSEMGVTALSKAGHDIADSIRTEVGKSTCRVT